MGTLRTDAALDPVRELELLVESRYPIVLVESIEQQRVDALLQRLARKMRVPLFFWDAAVGLRRSDSATPIYDSADIVRALANAAAIDDDVLFYFKGLAGRLHEPALRPLLQRVAKAFSTDRRALIVSGLESQLPTDLRHQIARHRLELPDHRELTEVATRTIEELSRHQNVELRLRGQDFDTLVRSLAGLTLLEAERTLRQAALRDGVLGIDDLRFVLDSKRDRMQETGALEAVPVTGEIEVAGLSNIKSWLAKRRRALEPEARAFGLPAPKGVLLLGVQGCGKSLTAKLVASSWGLPLLRLEAGRLYNKFIGESEANLDRALQTAERMAPCVLLIDEIEKAFATGSGDGDAGLSRRILGRLLSWLQERTAPVFVVATCNSVSQLPPEMMRKGRFDELFFVDLPDATERHGIFELHLARRGRAPEGFDLAKLVEAAAGFSGAEIEAVIVAGLYTAFAEDRDLSSAVILQEIAATRPLSVVRGEEIADLRRWAAGRTVPAAGAAVAA